MSNVVQFLEALACNPKPLSAEERVGLIVSHAVEANAGRALRDLDAVALRRLLGSRAEMACLIFPAEDEPREEEQREGDEDAPQQDTNALAA